MDDPKYVLFWLTVATLTQVLTGKIPFSSKKTNWMVALAVSKGDRPSRPEHAYASCTVGRFVGVDPTLLGPGPWLAFGYS